MKIYKITEASEYLGVSINTLKTLANNGKIKSFKTTGEHRRFRQEDLDAYMGVEKEKQEKLTVIYARCSTAKQKENLERQKDRLRKHAEAKGYKYVLIDEIASGINEKRNGIHKLIKMCFEGKIQEYKILRGLSSDLEKEVNEHITLGWKLHGDTFRFGENIRAHGRVGTVDVLLAQVVIREEAP
jgi:excisionase family DNA binding protein